MPTPRFPPEKESIAAQKIAEALDQLGAGPDDLALTQGACGGDLLFTEACLQRGVKVHWLQPFSEPDFIENSVVRNWRGLAPALSRRQSQTGRAHPLRAGRAGPPAALIPSRTTPTNAATSGCSTPRSPAVVDKVSFVCLWNGEGGDGPGGTAHMYNEVKRRTGRVTWIDTRKL